MTRPSADGMGGACHWYALNTKRHKERQVADCLRRRALEVYLPLVWVGSLNPRSTREQPLFPGYLFTRLDVRGVDFAGLQWTPGLRCIVQFGGEPALVQDDLIVEIKRHVSRLWAAGGQVFYDLQHGDPVRITDGPFAGYGAIFDLRLAGTKRVRVLLEVIEGQSRRRSVPTRYLPLELNVGSIRKVKPNLIVKASHPA